MSGTSAVNAVAAPHPDIVTLTINGRVYQGWKSLEVSRGVDRAVSDFRLEVSERWTGQGTPWQILPFAKCIVAIDGVPIITGYVDEYLPKIGPTQHNTEIAGRSRTVDLLECSLDLPAGSFTGYSLAAIARAVAADYGIGTVVNAPGAESAFADATFERSETAWTFLERLAKLSGVLLSDDAMGNLVLTTAGSAYATGSIVEGQNIQSAEAKLSSKNRHSPIIVKGQLGIVGDANWGGAGGYEPGGAPPPANTSTVQTQMQVTATDPAVPRYRPRVVMAESQMSLAQMQQRANWLLQKAFGEATHADITVQGWRQPDGTLWQVNTIVPVTSPTLGVDQDLMIGRVKYRLTPHDGRTTVLHVAPVQAYTPDPGSLKLRKKKGKGSNAVTWQGAGGS